MEDAEKDGGQRRDGEGAEGAAERVDWQAEARKWEERAGANAKAAEELEAQRKRADAAEAELSGYRERERRAAWARKASEKYGVPAEVLRGSTEKELAEHARALQPHFKKPATPEVDMGEPNGGPAGGGREELAKMLFENR